jgi:pyruvate dehydrogenase E1 component alpha subunit
MAPESGLKSSCLPENRKEEKMVPLDKQKLLQLYELMVLARRYEEKLVEIFASGKMTGWIHSCLGHEATGAALSVILKPEDYLIPYHRSRVVLLGKGLDLNLLTAEIFGKTTGICKGKSGEAHIADMNLGILGTSGIIGGNIPIAVGVAYAARLEGKGRVTVCGFGDGGTCRGSFHESLNMASVWDLPIVFYCENNLYAEFTPISGEMRIKDVADRAKAYGIPGITADGNDVLNMVEVFDEAITRVRNGKGPSLIEAKTYRYRGHYEGDPQEYKNAEEVNYWKQRDAVENFQKKLLREGILDEAKIQSVEKKVGEQISEALKFAGEGRLPTRDELLTDVYAEN